MATRFTKSLIGAALIGLTGLGIGGYAFAASGKSDHKMEHQDWGFNGMFGTYDRPAMQRGYQVYREVCAACHALEHLSFRHLGDEGGPFYDPEFPNPNDNEQIKAFAKDWMIPDIDPDTGDEIERPGIPADEFPDIFPNEPASRASNGGALPPDLSVITKARTGGADYLYDILMGYKEMPHEFEMSDGMSFNVAFDGQQIAMAAPLSDGIIEYAPITTEIDNHGTIEIVTVPGPEATVDQMSRDVVEFLAWAGDPKMEVRKRVGFATFLFLLLFAGLTFATYKNVWRDVKH
jgi:ubiquinol-cytochrome c reductase cytochrome c1 subunit